MWNISVGKINEEKWFEEKIKKNDEKKFDKNKMKKK